MIYQCNWVPAKKRRSLNIAAGRLDNCRLTASTGAGQVELPSYLEKSEFRKSTGAGQMVEANLGRGERTIDLFARQGLAWSWRESCCFS
ncbi:MAG: hypothetical protein ACOX4Q_05415 [Syntrophomonadales bacterium]